MKRKLLTLARHVALALASLAVALAVCELALRLYYPRYQFAANPPPSAEDREGGRASSRGFYTRAANPDTGVYHRLGYNWLGARTSRRITAESLAESVNIAFFGDSMTENIHLPVQYAFTEHLDYLLNHPRPGGNTESRFNVLNFGVFGSAAAKEFLRWRRVSQKPGKQTFDHVFYMFYHNDVGDLWHAIKRGIVRLDESGNVQRGDSDSSPPWKRLIARLHLTYLALDAWKRLTPAIEPEHSDSPGVRLTPDEILVAFQKVVLRWKREVEADGGRFHVVMLPSFDPLSPPPSHHDLVRQAGLIDPTLDLFDLLACFQENIADYNTRDWQFANNPHWDAAANMVAAHCLYRYLEDVFDLPPRTDAALAVARRSYYQAFLGSPNWEGQRFAPTPPWVPSAAVHSPPPPPPPHMDSAAIVNHYLALEVRHRPTEQEMDAVASARATGALAAADWEVFANLPERLLVYVKDAKAPCQETREVAKPFFLHVFPFTPEKLPNHQRRADFENRDHGPFTRMSRNRNECVFAARLPEWPVARIRTGQFTRQGLDGKNGKTVYHNHWAVEFSLPLVRSVWDVYAAEGGRRGLEYVKTPCAEAVREARFFLHIYPLRSADLPSSSAGYVNRDFQWDAGGHFNAVKDTCRISVDLPDFPIATIHTGQFRTGWITRRLWDARIRLAEVERLPPQAD